MVTETVDIRPEICSTPVYPRDSITLAGIILIILSTMYFLKLVY